MMLHCKLMFLTLWLGESGQNKSCRSCVGWYFSLPGPSVLSESCLYSNSYHPHSCCFPEPNSLFICEWVLVQFPLLTCLCVLFFFFLSAKATTLFRKNTKTIVWGMQTRAVQGMLDFDYVCSREEPSVAAMVYPFT